MDGGDHLDIGTSYGILMTSNVYMHRLPHKNGPADVH